MLEEIESEPAIIRDFKSKEFENFDHITSNLELSRMVYVVGNGTSYHAAQYLSILLNRNGKNSIPILSSEVGNWLPGMIPNTTSIVFSQSGDSIDALNSAEELKRKGSMVIGITNNRDAKLRKIANLMLYTDAGNERSVAATKSLIAQLFVALKISYHSKKSEFLEILNEAEKNTETIVTGKKVIRELVGQAKGRTVFLGSGLAYPIALETTLKLIETSNAISFAYATRDFLHGPKQLLDRKWSVFMLSPDRLVFHELDSYAKRVVDVDEFLQQKFGVTSENEVVKSMQSLLFGQLLSYYTSISLGLDPDRPSRLTKVVK
jgi:glucosamine--fructose-6-phosphate aminotransferase (isomerizing)